MNYAPIPKARLSDLAKSFFQGSRGSHDWEHTERVVRLTRHLTEAEAADPSITLPAAYLHDLARGEEDQNHGQADHALRGAELAQPLLEELGMPPDKVAAICDCIRTHRFRTQQTPNSLEAKVLFDADKLDSIGAIGIGRAFLFAGEIGAKLHNPETDPLTTLAYSIEDTAWREYMVKLRFIQDRMLTRTGKTMAQSRHAFMKSFFQRLDLEYQGHF
jgi:uncharacterized protein